MTEATWDDDAMTPDIDWRMSAALENVPRGDLDIAEVTSLIGAVRAWQKLDPQHRLAATLTPENPIRIEGVSIATFSGEAIETLARLRRPEHDDDETGPIAA